MLPANVKLFPMLIPGIVQPSPDLDSNPFPTLPAQQFLCAALHPRPFSEDLFPPQAGLPDLLSLKHDMAFFW